MTIVRVEARMQYTTLLPQDVSINVWHFESPGTFNDSDALAISGALDDFWNAPLTLPDPFEPVPLISFLSGCIVRGENALRLRFSDAQADPAPTLAETYIDLEGGFAFDGQNMPNEVAACLSFQGNPLIPTPLRNRRGRVYLGPLNTGVAGAMTVGGVELPALSTAFRNCVAEAAVNLTGLTTVPWVVYSPTLNDSFTVAEGWIDNEFDTQRRRQVSATARTTWVSLL